jgi:hypothetical protein
MKLFKKRSRSKLEKSMMGVIVVSPMLWLVINFLVLFMAWLMLPHKMIVPRYLMLLLLALIINGWFWAGLLMTYLFRDQSNKFLAPNISASLGEEDGFITYAPALINEAGKILEPEYVLRAVSGFSAFGLHTKGRVLMAYPRAYETYFPGGGISCHTWLRCCRVDQVAENVRVSLTREGAAGSVFTSANEEIWFGRTYFNVGEKVPDKIDYAFDVYMDTLMAEINRLKQLVGEKDFQTMKYEQRRSLDAFKAGPANRDFRNDYMSPPESVDEKTARLYGQAKEEIEARERRRNQY